MVSCSSRNSRQFKRTPLVADSKAASSRVEFVNTNYSVYIQLCTELIRPFGVIRKETNHLRQAGTAQKIAKIAFSSGIARIAVSERRVSLVRDYLA